MVEAGRYLVTEHFRRFSVAVTHAAGTPFAFALALLTIAAWFVYGCFVGFTDTVQLVINTGTTIVTFLMVFLIQNSQNRDSRAEQLKLDELLRAVQEARSDLMGLEEEPEGKLAEVVAEMRELGGEGGVNENLRS